VKSEEYPPHVRLAVEAAERAQQKAPGFALIDDTREALRRVVGSPPRAKGRPVTPPFRSELERDFSLHLEAAKVAGEIAWWAYEPWRFSLGGGAWYKVDFGVMLPGGELEAIEVKGFWREAARLRIKVAASKHPLAFKAVTRKEGAWVEETF
jgi:hypothetical protein